LIGPEGEVLTVNPAQIQGGQEGEGVATPTVELLKEGEGEETYRVAIRFANVSIETEIPKAAP